MKDSAYEAVLWDIDTEKIGTLPADFVIQRALSYGTLALIVKAIKDNGREAVCDIFEHMKPSSISAKKYHYLKNYLLA